MVRRRQAFHSWVIFVFPVLLFLAFAAYASLAAAAAVAVSRRENRVRHAVAAVLGALVAAPLALLPPVAAVFLVEHDGSFWLYGPASRLDLLLAATAAGTLVPLAGVPLALVWASRYLDRLVLRPGTTPAA